MPNSNFRFRKEVIFQIKDPTPVRLSLSNEAPNIWMINTKLTGLS